MNNFILTYVRFIKVTLFYKQIFHINTVLNGELNNRLNILTDRSSNSPNIPGQNGRALKIYEATENITYGCWGEGLYTVKGYNPGAPTDWGGILLVTHIRNSDNSFASYVKIFFSADCKIYRIRQTYDGTVDQNWTS